MLLRNVLIKQIDVVYAIDDNPEPQTAWERFVDTGKEGRDRAKAYKAAIQDMGDAELAKKVHRDTGSLGCLAKGTTLSFRLLQGVCDYYGITQNDLAEARLMFCRTLTLYSPPPGKFQYEIQAMRTALTLKFSPKQSKNEVELENLNSRKQSK